MTQTIAQTTPEEAQSLQSGGRPLLAFHAQLASILHSRLGSAHAGLLATPVLQPDGGVRWDTPLDGAVVALDQLDATEAVAIRASADRRIAGIRALAQELHTHGASSGVVAGMLEQAMQTPPGNWLYSVGGEPVLVAWGHGDPPARLQASDFPLRQHLPSAAANSVAAARSTAARVAAGKLGPGDDPAVGSDVGPAPKDGAVLQRPAGWRRWLPWLLLLLLCAGLLLLGLRRCGTPDEALRLEELEKQNRTYEEQLHRLYGDAQRFMCVPDPVASAPEPTASAPEPAASTPEAPAPAASLPEPAPSAPSVPPPPPSAPADPYGDLKKRIAQAEGCDQWQALLKDPQLRKQDAEAVDMRKKLQSEIAANCREQAIKQALEQCPGERPKDLAPQVALVFDASRSMSWSLNATLEDIRRAEAAEKLAQLKGGGALGNLLRNMGQQSLDRLYRDPIRITPARDAAGQLVRSLPSDVDVGLTMVDDCDTGARTLGFFQPARRPELLERIRGIEPRSGTPLADGVAKAGAMLDGISRASVMVVVSDGMESCGGDPCAAAAQLARTKPHLKINVIDITGSGSGNCLAAATGGKVFRADSAEEIAQMVQEAGKEALGPQNCKQ